MLGKEAGLSPQSVIQKRFEFTKGGERENRKEEKEGWEAAGREEERRSEPLASVTSRPLRTARAPSFFPFPSEPRESANGGGGRGRTRVSSG